ncbi:hypothetical protein MOBT1_002986 [Malassezia obtusa]|uniref:COP9 signalosome complex subunit 4 n=1 Tax=Malassezia obtusa TaxID=76774 RepID=A0AAF0IXN5_9BASI|nr:hypothetical protein MOBT1_002986 [Malassezia obtusa]
MTSVAARLADAAQIAAVGERIDAYDRILDSVMQLDGATLTAALDEYVHGAVLERANLAGAGLIAGRRCLALLAERLCAAHDAPGTTLADHDTYTGVLRRTLDATHEHAAALEDELAELRVLLADALEAQQRWEDAAHVLRAIPSDANRRSKPDTYWLRLNVRLLRLCLHAGALADADLYMKKASSLVHAARDAPDTDPLLLDFRRAQAELYDRQLRCYDAALRFYELSSAHTLPPPAQSDMLARAVASALVAPVSAPRMRLLRQLQRDARTHALPLGAPLALLADARIVRADTAAAIAAHLPPHLRAGTEGAPSALEDALAEHNVYAASRVYTTITLDSLAQLVQRPEDACEALVARMIVQKRLPPACSIHQVARAVFFAPDDAPLSADDGGDAPDAPADAPEGPVCPDAHDAERQCRDRRLAAALAYLSDAHARLQVTK